jgi:FkbM family methyltransferase
MRKIKIGNKNIIISNTEDERFIRHWDNVISGKWEPQTFEILDKFLNSENSCIDLGAWIGSTVLYSASVAKYVYAAEPDIVALDHLKSNIALNPNLKISLYEGVVSDMSGNITLSIKTADFGSSGSSILYSGGKSIVVRSITFDEFINIENVTDCNFIKMDIEGSELLVLPLIKDFVLEYKPVLYLSLHHKFFNNSDILSIKESLKIFNKFYDDKLNRVNLDEAINLKSLVAEV